MLVKSLEATVSKKSRIINCYTDKWKKRADVAYYYFEDKRYMKLIGYEKYDIFINCLFFIFLIFTIILGFATMWLIDNSKMKPYKIN